MKKNQNIICPVELTLSIIGGKWKVLIIRELLSGKKRFSQIHKAIKGITQKMLSKQLRELERDGIINRKIYPEIPPRVEYSLTEEGEKLRIVLESMQKWGSRYLKWREGVESAE